MIYARTATEEETKLYYDSLQAARTKGMELGLRGAEYYKLQTESRPKQLFRIALLNRIMWYPSVEDHFNAWYSEQESFLKSKNIDADTALDIWKAVLTTVNLPLYDDTTLAEIRLAKANRRLRDSDGCL